MSPRASSPLLRSLTAQLPQMVATLARYVQQESPSEAPAAIASLAALIAADFAALAPRIRQHRLQHYGPALQIDFPGPRRSPRLLLLGHTDTVYPLGTLLAMPWRERATRLYGPGVFDTKAGIVQALFALKTLLARGPLPCHVTLLLVPDEEVGSPASRALTTRLALGSNAVLVLEPPSAPKAPSRLRAKVRPAILCASTAVPPTPGSISPAAPRPLSKPPTRSPPSPGFHGPRADLPSILDSSPEAAAPTWSRTGRKWWSMCVSSTHYRPLVSMLPFATCVRAIPAAACSFSGASIVLRSSVPRQPHISTGWPPRPRRSSDSVLRKLP